MSKVLLENGSFPDCHLSYDCIVSEGPDWEGTAEMGGWLGGWVNRWFDTHTHLRREKVKEGPRARTDPSPPAAEGRI